MNRQAFDEFLVSDDTLRVYEGPELLFSSSEERLLALLQYIEGFAHDHRGGTIMDKVMGNAAALLAVKAGCREVYSPLGSQLAIETLDKYGVKYYLSHVVPYIMQANGKDMCPMEKLSINKTPDEFYVVMRAKIS